MINIQTLIDNSVQEWSDTKSAQRDNSKFSVSDAGMCYRARFLKRQGVPDTRVTPVGALRKMMAGEAGHEKLQEVLKASGHLVSSEEPLELWGEVLGHYDGVLEEGNSKTLVEFKTIEKFQMAHIKRDGPKLPHILQMFTYWYGLDEITAIPQATLIYVQREDFQQVQFDYLLDNEMEKMVHREWNPLLKYWEDEALPPCTCATDYGGHGISYCRYQDSPESCCNQGLFRKAHKAQ